jgi:hypothetical protein
MRTIAGFMEIPSSRLAKSTVPSMQLASRWARLSRGRRTRWLAAPSSGLKAIK